MLQYIPATGIDTWLTAEQSLLQQQHDAFPSFQIMPPLPFPSPPGRLRQKSADSIFETSKKISIS
jgi:hypothetical protein